MLNFYFKMYIFQKSDYPNNVTITDSSINDPPSPTLIFCESGMVFIAPEKGVSEHEAPFLMLFFERKYNFFEKNTENSLQNQYFRGNVQKVRLEIVHFFHT